MVPGLWGPAGGPCKSEDTTGWGLESGIYCTNLISKIDLIPLKRVSTFVCDGQPFNNQHILKTKCKTSVYISTSRTDTFF